MTTMMIKLLHDFVATAAAAAAIFVVGVDVVVVVVKVTIDYPSFLWKTTQNGESRDDNDERQG